MPCENSAPEFVPELDPIVIALLDARRAHGLTQHQLADAAGISRRTLVLIERGNSDCSLRTLRRLLDAMQLDLTLLKLRRPNLEDATRENERLFAEHLNARPR